jgi:hypothetical protein
MMSGRSEDQLGRMRNRPRLEDRLRPSGVVAVDQLAIGSVRVGRPEAEKVSVETVDVVPPRVQNPPVAGHCRQPLEILESGDGAQIPSVGVHPMQREHGDGPMVAAAAAHEAVGLGDVQGGLGTGLVGLQRGAFASRYEHDASVGQIACVEIIVTPVRQLSDRPVVQVHFEHVIERVLGQLVLVGLVRHGGQFGVMPAPREQHATATVRDVRIEETACGPVFGQVADGGMVLPETFQQEQPAAWPRPPAVVLIRDVREQRCRPFNEQDLLEVQQRIAQ